MDKYENLGMIGEGSYGMVMKCRHKETKQMVAIKKFLETEEDKMVKKIALREVRMLKQVRHENLVNLIEVFRRKKRLYLVFEFVDHTALDDLERYPTGAEEGFVKKIMFQVLRGVEFCHSKNIIHRDVKPENILISKRGVVKLCDFGFARTIAPPGEAYTDYVATRWYRAPELLVGDTNYGRAIDIWAVGCLFSEMLTGEPLFPGESDIDQLYLITKCFGNLIARHREIFSRNPLFLGMRLPDARELDPIERRYPHLSPAVMDIIKWSLRLDPNDRPTCSQLLRHELFTKAGWVDRFLAELRGKVEQELEENPLLKSLGITVHGSVHDSKHKASSVEHPAANNHLAPPKRHMQATLGDGYTTGGGYTTAGGLTSGTEALASDMEGVAAVKKEKKKKKSKPKELLHHREKTQPEKLKISKKPHSPTPHHGHHHHHPPPPSLTTTTTTTGTKLHELHNPSQHSLTGQRLSPRITLPPADLLTPTASKQFHPSYSRSPKPYLQRTSPHPPAHAHHSRAQSPPPNPAPFQHKKTIVSPPPSSILDHPPHRHFMLANGSTTSLSNQQVGHLRSEHPSETSLVSERGTRYRPNKLSPMMPDKLSERLGIASPAPPHLLTSPLGSPGATARLLPGGGAGYKKQYSKNKDTILLPHLKDVDLHHVKVAAQAPLMSGAPITSTSQSSGLGVGPMGNRGLLLGSLNPPIESFRGAPGMRPPPTPPKHAQPSSHQVIR